ncbi:hypothetical protein [Leuconostoc pseudomesenteroides]|uniref:hypothetical protein n=1 Tax=Leuconostoc pseudomesenteroides TaxID=33968 RepID=UPI002898C81A|nr:hypothetical protein [Leuconostoc pseudomesenteroides]
MKINWTKELVNRINAELAKGKNFPQIAKMLRKETKISFNKDDVRLGYQRHTDWIDETETVKPLLYQQAKKASDAMAKAFSSNTDAIDTTQPIELKKLANGDYSSSRTLNLSNEELRDEATLLKLHGYDPERWEIKTSSNSRNTRETNQGTKHSYNSRITVKTKQSLTLDDLKQELTKTYVEPMEVYKNKPVDSKDTLVISLFDLHYGITTDETIKKNLANLIYRMQKGYDKIVIISGGDVMHSDIIIGSRTTSGTELDPVDMKTAIQNARSFYDAIFRTALANSNHVEHYAIGGNHDRTTSYMFYLILLERFPQVEHHLDDYRLAFKVGNTGILVAHGDLAMKDIALLFATQYPVLRSQ